MPWIRVQIVRWVDDHQPGWVECHFVDAAGAEHRLVEKAPVLTDEPLGAASSYPRPGGVACTVLSRARGGDGHELVTVDTDRPWGLRATDGATRFVVRADQLHEDGS